MLPPVTTIRSSVMRFLLILPCLLWPMAPYAGVDHQIDVENESSTAAESSESTAKPDKPEKPDGPETSDAGRERPEQNGNGGGGKTNLP